MECMVEEGCQIKEPAARRIWRRLGRAVLRLTPARTPRTETESRRLAVLGIAGLLGAWALTLTFLGILRVPGPIQNPPRPIDGGSGWFFLGGGGMMALLSLAVWVAVLDRDARRRHALKIVQVASATVAVAALGWGLVRRVPGRAPWLAAIIGASLGVSWAAVRLERRRSPPRRKKRTPVG
jgi:cytochrome bd-type quinol oxidase subunit 1